MHRHRTFGLSFALIFALLAAPASFRLITTARGEEEKVQKSELHKKMEQIDDGMKKLKRTLRKPEQNEVSLKVITKNIELATECRDLVPSKAAKLPADQRAAFVDDYKKTMAQLIDTMGQMKTAIEAGDNKKAMALHKSLKSQEEDGHDKFMESDEKEAGKKADDSGK